MLKRNIILFFGIIFIPFVSWAQSRSEVINLDQYLDRGKTIVVAKCLSVGMLKASLEVDATMQILHIVKGKEEKREIFITSKIGMKEGRNYLLWIENEAQKEKKHFYFRSRHSVIQMPRGELVEKLQAFPVKTQILRILNQRQDELESEIRWLNNENEIIKAVLKG